jgi:hypothetical protein
VKGFITLKKRSAIIRDKTIIQFDFVERISAEEFERRIRSREMERQNQKITDAELQSILSCLRSIREDTPDEVFELVF